MCTPPNGQIWSLYQPRSQIPQAITIWSRLPRESSVPPLVCGADLKAAKNRPGKSEACGLQPVTARSANHSTARQWSRVPPSGHRRVRGILRSASITRLADCSHPLREGTRSRTSNTAGTGATIAAATVLMGIKG